MFGVSTAAQIDIDKTKLVERDNPMSRYETLYFIFQDIQHSLPLRRVIELVRTLQEGRSRTLKLTIVRQRDKLEIVFKVTSTRHPFTTKILIKLIFSAFSVRRQVGFQ